MRDYDYNPRGLMPGTLLPKSEQERAAQRVKVRRAGRQALERLRARVAARKVGEYLTLTERDAADLHAVMEMNVLDMLERQFGEVGTHSASTIQRKAGE